MQGVAVSRRQLSVNSDQDLGQTYYITDVDVMRRETETEKGNCWPRDESCVVCRYCGANL